MAAKSAISLLSTFDKAAPVAAPTIKTAENKSPSKASLWRGCSFIETPASILFLAVSVSFGDITSAADSFSDELTAFFAACASSCDAVTSVGADDSDSMSSGAGKSPGIGLWHDISVILSQASNAMSRPVLTCFVIALLLISIRFHFLPRFNLIEAVRMKNHTYASVTFYGRVGWNMRARLY